MTKFQLGLLVGCFLGALVMFVMMGIIQLYLQERQEKNGRAREKTALEIQASIGRLANANQATPPDHLPFLALDEAGAEDDVTVCYLFIIIE